MSEIETTVDFAELREARYVRLTTFRRDGTPVSTPVWCVVEDGVLYVWTDRGTGKVKRIVREPRVTVGASTARGTPTGPAYAASARVLDGDEGGRAYQLIKQHYRSAGIVYGLIGLVLRLTRRGRGYVGVAVEPLPSVDLPAQRPS